MKTFRSTFGKTMSAAAAVPLLLAVSTPVLADSPILTITSPTAATTVFVPSFPAVVPITFTVEHSELKNLNVLRVEVDGVSILGTPSGTLANIGNPFTNANLCSSDMVASNNITGCVPTTAATAIVMSNWTVDEPRSDYVITVSAKHRSDVGDDEETVEVILLNVEYPAPPAVANAYMKSKNYTKTLTGGCRGSITSQIAQNHGMYESYGPKGGPYDVDQIKADVETYKLDC